MAQAPRLALVTGAARGIGRAIAAELLGDGFAVIAVDRDGKALLAIIRALSALGPVEAEVADIGCAAAIERLAERVAAGSERLNALVNNAATACNRPLCQLTPRERGRVVAVNLTGPFPLVRAFAHAPSGVGCGRQHHLDPGSHVRTAH